MLRREALDPEAEVSALLRRLLHAAQPALSGEFDAAAVVSVVASADEESRSSHGHSGSAAALDSTNPDEAPIEVLPASSVRLMPSHAGGQFAAADASDDDEEEMDAEAREGGVAGSALVDVASLPREHQGVALHLSKHSACGYTGVIRRGAGFALRRCARYGIDDAANYATAIDAAVQYATAVAASKIVSKTDSSSICSGSLMLSSS